MREQESPAVTMATRETARTLRKSGLMLLASLTAMGINAVTGVLVARMLSVEKYGEYSYFMRLYSLAMFIVGLGLATKLLTDVAVSATQMNSQSMSRAFYSLLVMRLITIIPMIGVGIILALVQQNLLYVIVMLGASAFLLLMMFTAFLQGQERTAAVAVLWVVQPLVFLGLFVMRPHTDILSVFVMFLASIVFALLVAVRLCFAAGLSYPEKEHLSSRYMMVSLRFGGQTALISLLQMLYESLPPLVLGILSMFERNAIIAAPLNLILMIPATLNPLLNTVFYPHLRRQIATEKLGSAEQYVWNYVSLMSVWAIIPTALLMVQPMEVIGLLYTSKYVQSVPVLVIMAPLAMLILLERLMTWVFIAYGNFAGAMRVLFVRLVLLAAGVSVAIISGNRELPRLIAFAYVGSSLVAVILQVWLLGRAAIRNLLSRIALVTLLSVLAGGACALSLPASVPSFLSVLITLVIVTAVAAVGFWGGLSRHRSNSLGY